ncbi:MULTISPECIES: hypothetical protein [unclassified Clostridium]|uniref:hypothetical protein n=1 Tax=unclassified Clostridium TaxID=2614128 RepID=UPI00207A80ED|nr:MULTISPECIES: hypothetical protein [unclassified Clostridium]
MIKYNKNMIECLRSIEISHKDFLDKIMRVWPEFLEIKGFVLLKKCNDTVKKLDEKKYYQFIMIEQDLKRVTTNFE